MVMIDFAEKAYLAGFPLLQLFVTLFPILTKRRNTTPASPACEIPFVCPESETLASSGLSELEFLPLMLTSVYCAVGLVWAFLRLSYLYLRE